MVQEHENIVGLDAAILMSPKVWEASGHLEAFSDPLVECKKCHHRFRADHVEGTVCPDCGGELTEAKQFNLMVETYLGVVEGEKLKTYLRGEITQGVHVNFKQVVDSTRVKIPFGIAQVGKAFRNEITPSGFTFRSREFEQMELQFYITPSEEEGNKWIEYWKAKRKRWYMDLGMHEDHLRFREHAPDERAHYARAAYDVEFRVPGEGDGWKEMEGIHNRGDWDVGRHAKFSGKDLTYFDEEKKERFIPWVIETSGGVDRATLFFLMDAYVEEEIPSKSKIEGEENNEKETRIVLKLHPKLAPYKAAVFPLLANKPDLVEKAQIIRGELAKQWMIAFDARGNIGKRYRAQDEIGTPFCITVDFDSLKDDMVTVRDRDTMEQERIKISELKNYLAERLK